LNGAEEVPAWDIHESVSPDIRREMEELLKRNRAQFAFCLGELRQCSIATLKLDLTTEEPVAYKQRRLAPQESAAALAQIKEWLEARDDTAQHLGVRGAHHHAAQEGRKRRTSPPTGSAGTSGGSTRITKRERYPMQRPEEIFDRLGGRSISQSWT